MNIKEDFTCKLCKEIYKDPVFLNCCGENVCKMHIDELFEAQQTNVSCALCSKDLPSQKFHINKVMKNLIDRDVCKLDIDRKYEDVLEQLKMKIDQIENMHKEPENVIFNKIRELKRQVDLDKEEAKLKIDESAAEIIKKLDSYETEFKAGCQSISDSEYNGNLVANMKIKLAEYESVLRSLCSNNQERDKKSKETKHAIFILETEIQEYESKLFKNKTLDYEPMINKAYFGKLIVSAIFFIPCEFRKMRQPFLIVDLFLYNDVK